MRTIYGIELIKFLCAHGYWGTTSDDGLAHLFRTDDTFMLRVPIDVAPESPVGDKTLIYSLKRAGYSLQTFKDWLGIKNGKGTTKRKQA
jgi:hypothetical protein